MNITKTKDSMGIEITPPLNFTSGLVRYAARDQTHFEFQLTEELIFSRPEAFECTIKPRSEKAVRLIKQMNIVNG